MSEDAMAGGEWKAPYVSYETFVNFFDKKLAGQMVPPRIDNHFLDTYAGSVRPLVMSALKTMGMVSDSGATLEPLRIAAEDPSARRQIMRDWAEKFYQEQLALAEKAATASMLWESFSQHGYNGSTLRKAVVFYLALVDELGLPNSPFFKPPRQAPSKSTTSGRKTARQPVQPDPEPQTATPQSSLVASPGAETKRVLLGDAGAVTVITEVRWLDLPEEKFLKLRKAIREIEALAAEDAAEHVPDAEGCEQTDE